MPPNTAFNKSEVIPSDAQLDSASLEGKSVIITGGASGIGEACLRAFVAAGAFVTFGDLADDLGNAIVAELGGENVAFVHCDVTKWAGKAPSPHLTVHVFVDADDLNIGKINSTSSKQPSPLPLRSQSTSSSQTRVSIVQTPYSYKQTPCPMATHRNQISRFSIRI